MTWTSPPPTWQRRHSDVLTDGMAADSAAAAAVGPEAGTLAMEAMEATAMAAEVPWASIGTFLLMFRGVLMHLSADVSRRIDDEWRARVDGKVPAFRTELCQKQEKKAEHDNRNPETRKSEEM